jgi:DNA-directed RNA polymerase specialized sigma24 family protein
LEYARTMRYDQPTDMGGVGEAFLTTHWSLLEDVGSTNEEKDRAMIGLLLSRYWKPVYCFLRRKGYDNEHAKDLTQDFFHDIVLGRSLIQRADQSKGRFRSFLLTALQRYLINVEHAKEAQKRIPKDKLVSLEDIDPTDLPQITPELTAEASFDYGWTSALLERVLDEVKAQCHADGRALYWHVFHDRILQPIKERANSPSVQETCTKYNIADGIKLSNMIVTVKRRIQSVLKRHVCDSVMSNAEVGEELETIMRFFPGLAQNPE